ncbi:MAG: hypothetical protein MUF34_00105 [Polyangiaceae bacterium]|nr:hypothetical protein [Polyangiaceae bacterium]
MIGSVASRAALVALALAASGCGALNGPRSPGERVDGLARSFAGASSIEQSRPGVEAMRAYLDLVDEGLAAGPEGTEAVIAGLDALFWRTSSGLGRVSGKHALAYRVPGAMAELEPRLAKAYGRGEGSPPARALLAEALSDVARLRGDAAATATWRARTGSVSAVTAVGPLDWAPLTGIDRPTPLEEPNTPMLAAYPGVAPFSTRAEPAQLERDDYAFDVRDAGVQPGVYALALDVEVPRSGRIWLGLQTSASAQLVACGTPALARPYAAGGNAVFRFGAIEADAGRCRVVVRFANNDDGGRLAVWALADDGTPLRTSAPRAGDRAPARARRPFTWAPSGRASASELSAAALLGLGDARAARRLIEPKAQAPDAPPLAALVWARAVERADDVPDVRRPERARTAYEKVLRGWPTSWEATLGKALYGASRRGAGEGRVETLIELARARQERPSLDPALRAFEGVTAHEISMYDRAEEAFAAVSAPLHGTLFLREFEASIRSRVGPEAVAHACGNDPARDRSDLTCLVRLEQRGDIAGSFAEIARLRALRGAPRSLWAHEAGARLAAGDSAALLAFYDRLLPGQRALGLLAAADAPEEARRRLWRDALTARDSPGSIAPLLRLLGSDPSADYEAISRRAVEADRKSPSATAATVVIAHDERYDIDASGLLRAIIYDVRRVAGTSDVEQGVGGTLALVLGRDVRRALRRRIFKPDGRVLEPDRASNAAQGDADLSQLEPGDYVEQLVELYALPNRAGQLVVDGPDLLPERTSVAKASIELRYPRSLPLKRWAHPLLGKPELHAEGDVQIVRYRLERAPPRRLEEDVPSMERDATLSFGTYEWTHVGRHIGEQLRSLVDDDAIVRRWARESAGDAPPRSRRALERLVVASGKAVRVPNGALFADVVAALGGGPQRQSARYVLELGQGSRTLLLYQALRSLDVPTELVVAERSPFAADPAFPPRPGRFDRPLLVVHLPPDAGGEIWVDADVDGPPLPAGRVSPEVRGRSALDTTGRIRSVPASIADDDHDDVDIRLKVDARGDAQGIVNVTLRGRPAQGLADALETVVGTDRREMLRSVFLGWLPWANVNDVSLVSGEGAWQIVLRADVTIPGYAQPEGSSWVLPGFEPLHLIFPRPYSSTLGSMYAARGGRQNALAIDTAYQYRVRRSVELPEGASPPERVHALEVRNDRLAAKRSGAVRGRTVEEEFALSLTIGTVSSADYERFARDAKIIDDGFLASLRLARAPAPAAAPAPKR